MDKSGADAFGEAILYRFNFTVISSIIVRLIITLTILLFNSNTTNDTQKSTESKLINKITFIAYGILSGYYISLFLTDFLENYQPAWEAYSFFIIIITFFFLFSQLIKKYSRHERYFWLKNLYLFFSSLSLVMGAVIVTSFSFALFAMTETNKIVRKYKNQNIQHCIQPKINTWLDLTPVTTWNKRSGDWGPATNHAVLVIKNSQTFNLNLYNWSYKSRKWEYLTTGFSPSSFSRSPSSLRCTLDSQYSKKLPFLFPKQIPVNIGNKKLNIPYKYFAIEELNSVINNFSKDYQEQKTIKFLATPPSFSSIKQISTKLPKRYHLHTNIYVSNVVDDQDLTNKFNIFPGQNFEEQKGKYGLNKRILQRSRYSQERIRYYKVQDGFVNTVIDCLTDNKGRMNCQHSFIYDNLIYNFSHSEKDLKNWYDLQINLVNRVKSWEVP